MHSQAPPRKTAHRSVRAPAVYAADACGRKSVDGNTYVTPTCGSPRVWVRVRMRIPIRTHDEVSALLC
jgi:hypothetical protein